MWIYTGNKCAKVYGNILSLSENIAKSFREATFFDSHCIYACENVHNIFILFHQTMVAKKHRHIPTHTLTHTVIQIHKNNIYTHMTVYVEAVDLHHMANTLFHSLDK